MADDQTLQIVLEAVNNMTQALSSGAAAVAAIEGAVKSLDGQEAKIDIDTKKIIDAIVELDKLSQKTDDVKQSASPVADVFNQVFGQALNPVNMLSQAVGIFGGNVLTNLVGSITSVLNPMNLLSMAFDAVTGGANMIYTAITTGAGMAFDGLTFVVNSTISALSSLGSILLTAGGYLVDFGLSAGGAVLSGLSSLYEMAKVAASAIFELGKAAVEAFREATSVAANFQQAMANVKSLGVENEEAFNSMREAALKLGKDTSLSSTDAANALYALRSAGLSSSEAVAALQGTGRLAEATTADLGFTAEAVAATIKQFGLEASRAEDISNTFAAGIQNSALTMERISGGMKYAGAVAGTLGISFEEVTATLMVMNNAGIRGEQAGTALRGALSKLIDPSKEVKEMVAALGLGMDQVNPSIHGVVGVVDALAKSGATTADIVKIFGQEAGPAMAQLVGQGATAITDFQTKITGTQAAIEMSKVQLDSYNGALNIIKGSYEALQISIGDIFLPTMTRLVLVGTEVINFMIAWVQETGIAAAATDALKAAGDIVASVFAALQTTIGSAGATLMEFGKAIAEALRSFSAWAAALISSSQTFDQFKQDIATIAEAALRVGVTFIDLVVNTNSVGSAFSSAVTYITGLVAGFATLTSAIATNIAEWIKSGQAYNTLRVAAAAAGVAIKAIVDISLAVAGAVARTVAAVLEFGLGLTSGGKEAVSFTGFLVNMATALSALADTIVSALANYGEWIATSDTLRIALEAGSTVLGLFKASLEALGAGVQAALASITNLAEGIKQFIVETEQGVTFDFSGALTAAFQKAKEIINQAAPEITDAIVSIFSQANAEKVTVTITKLIAAVKIRIVDGFKATASDSSISAAFVAIFEFIRKVGKDLAPQVTDFVATVFTAITNAFKENATALGAQMGTIFGGIAQAAGEALSGVMDAITRALSGGGEGATTGGLADFFTKMVETAKPGIKAAFDSLGTSVAEFFKAAMDAAFTAMGLPTFAEKFINPLVDSIKAGDWKRAGTALKDVLLVAVTEGFKAFIEGAKAVLSKELAAGLNVGEIIVFAMGTALAGLGALMMASPAIIAAAGAIGPALGTLILGAFATFGPILLTGGLAAVIITALGAVFAYAFPEATKTIQELAAKFVTGVVDALKGLAGGIFDGIKFIANSIGAGIVVIAEAIGKLATSAGEKSVAITEVFKNLPETIGGYISAIGNKIVEYAQVVLDAVKNFGSSVIDLFMSIFSGATGIVEAVGAFLNDNILTPIYDFAGVIVETISGLGSDIYDAFMAIFEFITEIPGQAVDWGKNIVNAFVDGIMGTLRAAKDGIASAVSSVFAMFKGESPPKEGPLKDIDKWGVNVGTAWTDGVAGAISGGAEGIAGAAAKVSVTFSSGPFKNMPAEGAKIGNEFGTAIAGSLDAQAQSLNRQLTNIGGAMIPVAKNWAIQYATTFESVFGPGMKSATKPLEEFGVAATASMGTAGASAGAKLLANIATGAATAATGAEGKAIKEQLKLLASDPSVLEGAKKAGNLLASEYGTGILMGGDQSKSRVKELITAVTGALEGIDAEMLKKSGAGIIDAFVEGMIQALGTKGGALKKQLKEFIAPMIAHSPPKVGPLTEIDAWGEGIGSTWIDGVTQAMARGTSALETTLNTAASAMQPTLPAERFAANPEAATVTSSAGAVTLNMPINGSITINTGEDREQFFRDLANRVQDGMRRSGATGRTGRIRN